MTQIATAPTANGNAITIDSNGKDFRVSRVLNGRTYLLKVVETETEARAFANRMWVWDRKMTEGATVRQIDGPNVGAIGTVTRVVEPDQHYADGTPANGRIRVTFPGIRYPEVGYSYGSAHRFIDIAQ